MNLRQSALTHVSFRRVAQTWRKFRSGNWTRNRARCVSAGSGGGRNRTHPARLRAAPVLKGLFAAQGRYRLRRLQAVSAGPGPCSGFAVRTAHVVVEASWAQFSAPRGECSTCRSIHLRVPPDQRTSLSITSSFPRQCERTTSAPAERTRLRRTRAATIASSSGPAIGMNSGIRSIGDAIHVIATSTSSLERRGTRVSWSSPRNRWSRFGISRTRSRAKLLRPATSNTATTTSQGAAATARPSRICRSAISSPGYPPAQLRHLHAIFPQRPS